MIFGQVLQLVVTQVATEPHGGQDSNLPVVHAASAAFAAGALVDILPHQSQQLSPQGSIAVEVLQPSQDGDDLIPTVEVEGHLADGQAIQALLRTGQTHVDLSEESSR